MPCFPLKQQLSCCPRRDKRVDLEKLVVKPVRTSGMRYHGLLGFSNVSQHLIFDDNWTPSSLSEQFAHCIDLLGKYLYIYLCAYVWASYINIFGCLKISSPRSLQGS